MAMAAFLGACSMGLNRLRADYGTSYELEKANQILHPDAERDLTPVYGMSAIAAEGVMERYYSGFEAQKPAVAPAYTIPVGRIAAGPMQ
jgi:hypothetical protein